MGLEGIRPEGWERLSITPVHNCYLDACFFSFVSIKNFDGVDRRCDVYRNEVFLCHAKFISAFIELAKDLLNAQTDGFDRP